MSEPAVADVELIGDFVDRGHFSKEINVQIILFEGFEIKIV